MIKVEQKNLNLEGEYQKVGTKLIHKLTGVIFHILKRKQPTPQKPPFYLFTNELGKGGYISSLYPKTDSTAPPQYTIEYKGIVYDFTEYPTQVIIELTPKSLV